MLHKLKDEQLGQGLVEYAILFAAVAAVIVVVLTAMGVNVRDAYCQVTKGIGISDPPGCAAPVQAAADPNQYQNDFSGGGGSGGGGGSAGGGGGGSWTYDGSQPWTTNNGKLCGATNDGTGTTRMFADGTKGTDYVIDTHATLNQGNGYAIFFRASGTSSPPNGSTFQNGYTFQYDPGLNKFVFRKWVNGKEMNPPIESEDPPKNMQWNATEHEIKLRIHKDKFFAYVDGKMVLKGSDDTFDSGYVGLRLLPNSSACFNDLSVQPDNSNSDGGD